MVTEEVFEIVIEPPSGSTGQELIKLIDCLRVFSRFPAVVVADVECNGDRSWVGKPPFSVKTQEVLDYAARVGQFDWATFFFFREPYTLDSDSDQFEALFADAQLVIRAVDDT